MIDFNDSDVRHEAVSQILCLCSCIAECIGFHLVLVLLTIFGVDYHLVEITRIVTLVVDSAALEE